MQYDVEKNFAPVSLMMSLPFILTINLDKEQTASISTLGDLNEQPRGKPRGIKTKDSGKSVRPKGRRIGPGEIKLVRNKPDQFSHSSAGLGNLTQLLSLDLLK